MNWRVYDIEGNSRANDYEGVNAHGILYPSHSQGTRKLLIQTHKTPSPHPLNLPWLQITPELSLMFTSS